MSPDHGLSRRDAWLLGVVSVVLSVLLWLQVATMNAPTAQKEFLIRLEAARLPEGLVVTQIPEGVTVVVSGREAELERIDSSGLVATVDLARVKAGTHTLPVLAPSIGDLAVRLKRPMATLVVEKLELTSREVEVEVQGRIQSGLRYDGAESEPQVVQLSGPASQIGRVRKVRAMLDLSVVQPGRTHQINLEVLGLDNTLLPDVVASPRRVNVLPQVAAAPTTNTYLVAPIWRGQPAFGWRVVEYNISPNTVTLGAPSARLAQITTVETEPIDITGLNESRTFTVRLRLPEGAQTSNVQEVRVFVRLEPAGS